MVRYIRFSLSCQPNTKNTENTVNIVLIGHQVVKTMSLYHSRTLDQNRENLGTRLRRAPSLPLTVPLGLAVKQSHESQSTNPPSFDNLWICYSCVCHVNMNSTSSVPCGSLEGRDKSNARLLSTDINAVSMTSGFCNFLKQY